MNALTKAVGVLVIPGKGDTILEGKDSSKYEVCLGNNVFSCGQAISCWEEEQGWT